MTRHNLADCYIVDPTARLRVWTVDAIPVARNWCPEDPFPVRVPAYTAAEAAQVAATLSGLPREEWAAYFFIPHCHEEGTTMSVFPTAPSYHVHTVRLKGGGRYYQVVANRVHDNPVHGLWTEHRVLAVYANGGPEQYHKAVARRDAARLAGEWPDDMTPGADA